LIKIKGRMDDQIDGVKCHKHSLHSPHFFSDLFLCRACTLVGMIASIILMLLADIATLKVCNPSMLLFFYLRFGASQETIWAGLTMWQSDTFWMWKWIVSKETFLAVNDTAVQAMHNEIPWRTAMPSLVIQQTLFPSHVADRNIVQ